MLREILLPRTDAGVLFQVVLAAVTYGTLIVAVRRNRDVLSFVVGLATITAAWFAFRAVH